jgi:hypothetical protein
MCSLYTTLVISPKNPKKNKKHGNKKEDIKEV